MGLLDVACRCTPSMLESTPALLVLDIRQIHDLFTCTWYILKAGPRRTLAGRFYSQSSKRCLDTTASRNTQYIILGTTLYRNMMSLYIVYYIQTSIIIRDGFLIACVVLTWWCYSSNWWCYTNNGTALLVRTRITFMYVIDRIILPVMFLSL